MILLNILYALIMTACATLAVYIVKGQGVVPWQWILAFFLVWLIGHCIYDAIAHHTVKWFNRDGVYRG